MIEATRCPDAAALAEHVRGSLAADAERSVVAHLDHCEDCQQALEMLAAGSMKLLRTARQAGGGAGTEEHRLQAVLDTLTAPGRPAATPWTVDDVLSMLEPPLRVGELGRLGQYALQEVIGRGGMSIVFKAFDEKLQRVVAIKVLAPPLATNAAARRRFLREARAAAAVHNDHVIDIYAVEEGPALSCIVMEYVAGGSLLDYLKRTGPLELKEILRIGTQIALGLAAAHRQGLIHRDVKPANILLESDAERVKLTDFGLACVADNVSAASNGVIAGTPQYMAPEQARGEAVDHRADLFSLGSVLYVLATGREPFAGSDTMAVIREVQAGRPRPVSELGANVPEWLASIIARLQAERPQDRFASAAEVAEVLGRYLAQRSQTPRRGVRRALIAAALLFAAGALGWSLWYGLTSGQNGDTPDDRKGSPAAPIPAKIWPPKVLIVLPAKDFFHSDYITVRTQLSNAGVTCVVAAPTRDEVEPLDMDPTRPPVKPDVLLADVKAADYSAIYFPGGRGMADYFDGGAHASEARRLIQEALAAKRWVTALGMGPRVLADAGVLKDVRATCYQFDQPAGFYVNCLKNAGAIYVDEPAVTHGQFVTGRNPNDTREFIQELRERLGVP